MKTILEKHWYHLLESEAFDFLETSPDRGLDIFAVSERQEQFGPNQITQKKGTSPLVLFLLQFHLPLRVLTASCMNGSMPASSSGWCWSTR